MATYATLTVNVEDIIGADFDKSRASVWIETNTPHGLVVVDGTTVRLGGRRESPSDAGVVTFANLVTTNSADNPTSFAYRVRILYVPKGSRAQGRDELATSEFPLTADANLASISEAWDGVALPVNWRSDFLDEIQAIEAATAEHRAAVEAVVIEDLGTTDGQTKTLIETDGTLTKTALTAAYARVYTPEAYGAVGDGVADDTTAVQAALTAAGNDTRPSRVQLDRTYRCTRNLYGFGATTFEGPGWLVVDADMTLADGLAYWFNLGVKSKGGTRSTWTGRMSINIRATANAVYERTVNLHSAVDVVVTGCRFDLTAMTTDGIEYPGGAITAYSNSAWCADPERARIRVSNNTFIASQKIGVGSEGIGLNAPHVWVTDNYVYGFGDDPIAIHACDYFTVRGNRCFTPDGRLIIRSSRWGTVSENHLARIADSTGAYASGGGLFEFNLYDAGAWNASTGITVTNNYLHLPAGVTGPTYMMRAKGIRDCAIEGNEFHSDSPDTTVAALVVEAESLPGWTDPAGVDTPGTAKVYKLRVAGNYVTGSQPRKLSENGADIIGPITYADNLFTSYAITSAGSIFQPSNRVLGGSPDGLTAVDGGRIPQANLLFEGDLSVNNTGVTKVTRNGVDRWYPRRKCIITAIEVETSAAITAGFFTVQLKKNGGAAAATEDVGMDTATPRGRRVTYYAGTNNRATASTDYFELVTQGVGLTPDPSLCRVRVFGVYTDA